VVILAMLFMPSAMAVMASFDATRSQHLPLPRGTVRGPESVAFDGHGQGPYSSASDGRVFKWNGDKLGWTTYSHGLGYDSKLCTATKFRPETATESRWLVLRFNQKSGDLYIRISEGPRSEGHAWR
jgi:hypothetical protein